MKKITIIGLPGAGKTTLAKKLEHIYNIKVYHLDRIFWGRGWKGKPQDIRLDALQKLVEEKQWIIEGFYFDISKPRLDAADTIIFLDMSPWLCLRRLFKRHHQHSGLPRRDIPQESPDKLDWRLVRRVLLFRFQDRKRLERLLETYDEKKNIYYLRSPEEVEIFLAQQKQLASKMPFVEHIPKTTVRVGKQLQPMPAFSS